MSLEGPLALLPQADAGLLPAVAPREGERRHLGPGNLFSARRRSHHCLASERVHRALRTPGVPGKAPGASHCTSSTRVTTALTRCTLSFEPADINGLIPVAGVRRWLPSHLSSMCRLHDWQFATAPGMRQAPGPFGVRCKGKQPGACSSAEAGLTCHYDHADCI